MRTQVMYQNLEQQRFEVKSAGGRSCLQTNGEQILILDGSITDFTSTPMVSIGAGAGNREIIYFDPKSKYLADQYQAALKTMLTHKASEKGGKLTDKEILDATMLFIKDIFTSNDEDAVKRFCEGWTGRSEKGVPIIPLDEFLKNRLGVCRHHALLASFLLDSLIKDKILSPGKIHHQRSDVFGGAHVWVIYEPDDMHRQDAYLVDSLWHSEAHHIIADKAKLYNYGAGLRLCQMKYTDTFNQRVQALHKQHFNELSVYDDRVIFIDGLLSKSPAEREAVIAQQNIGDLRRLDLELINPFLNAAYKENEDLYKQLRKEILKAQINLLKMEKAAKLKDVAVIDDDKEHKHKHKDEGQHDLKLDLKDKPKLQREEKHGLQKDGRLESIIEENDDYLVVEQKQDDFIRPGGEKDLKDSIPFDKYGLEVPPLIPPLHRDKIIHGPVQINKEKRGPKTIDFKALQSIIPMLNQEQRELLRQAMEKGGYDFQKIQKDGSIVAGDGHLDPIDEKKKEVLIELDEENEIQAPVPPAKIGIKVKETIPDPNEKQIKALQQMRSVLAGLDRQSQIEVLKQLCGELVESDDSFIHNREDVKQEGVIQAEDPHLDPVDRRDDPPIGPIDDKEIKASRPVGDPKKIPQNQFDLSDLKILQNLGFFAGKGVRHFDKIAAFDKNEEQIIGGGEFVFKVNSDIKLFSLEQQKVLAFLIKAGLINDDLSIIPEKLGLLIGALNAIYQSKTIFDDTDKDMDHQAMP